MGPLAKFLNHQTTKKIAATNRKQKRTQKRRKSKPAMPLILALILPMNLNLDSATALVTSGARWLSRLSRFGMKPLKN